MEQAHSLAKKFYFNKSSNHHKFQAIQKVCLSKKTIKSV
jgi:hypothetical protein